MGQEAVELARRGDCLNEEADSLVALGEVLELSGDRERAADAVREALGLYAVKENLVSAKRARERLNELAV